MYHLVVGTQYRNSHHVVPISWDVPLEDLSLNLNLVTYGSSDLLSLLRVFNLVVPCISVTDKVPGHMA